MRRSSSIRCLSMVIGETSFTDDRSKSSRNATPKTASPQNAACGFVQCRLCTREHKRKNWIHVGSEKAGPKVAAILSVVETCRRLKLPLRDYLAGVLPGLGEVSVQRVGQYTPAAWAASGVQK